jgi:hypothetical protein
MDQQDFDLKYEELMKEAMERAMYGNRKSAKNFIKKL